MKKKSGRNHTAHLMEKQNVPGLRGRVLRNKLCIESAHTMRTRFPIIHIIGLPGAGKTTLGKKLSKKYHLPVFYIGAYRSKFPSSEEGEADAWVALFKDLSKRKWANCILETTGLNSRELFLKAAFPFSKIISIKLIAQRKILYERIGKKKKNERGGEWLFSDDFQDKYEFVRKMFKHFKDVPSEIEIDTTKLTLREVFEKAKGELVFWEL